MPEASLESVRIHGHQVRYRRRGSGPTILLIHGIAGSSRSWQSAMALLAHDFDVIAPDLIGHGESAKPLGDYSLGAYASGLRDLLAVLDVERATFVGQSLGGGIAMQMAYQYPELCERLVLVDSGGLGREVSWLLRSLTLPGAELVAPLLFPRFVRGWGDSVGSFLHDRGLRSGRVSESWRAYASLTETSNRQAFIRTMRSVIDPGGQSVSANDRLYLTSRVPTLIVWGDRDAIIPVAHAHAAHHAMPGSRLEIIPGLGHFPHVEEPHRFAEIVTDFIRTTDPAIPDRAELATLLREHSGRP
ncbi:MAG: alpha/beta fold hydrolase [Actinomycetota bacterium]|nr:alpha/beta fold hydrolase [Actinomycetota bacterium]